MIVYDVLMTSYTPEKVINGAEVDVFTLRSFKRLCARMLDCVPPP